LAGQVSPEKLTAQMRAAARELAKANRQALESCRPVVTPIMRSQASAAAGPDRRLSRAPKRGILSSDWIVRGAMGQATARLKATGPWGIRDNSYVGGNTAAHEIHAKNAPRLIFKTRDGRLVNPKMVHHPGSARAPFWQRGVDQFKPLVLKIVGNDNVDAVASAFGSPFKSRKVG